MTDLAELDARRVYSPRGAIQQLFHCRDPEVLVAGAAGTGKTRGCLEKLMLAGFVSPGMKALIVRKVGATLGGTTLATWREKVAKVPLRRREIFFYGGSREEPPGYRYVNGSMIAVGGMDNPIKIMSSDYDLIYAGEATELDVDDWEALTTRLRYGRLTFQQLMGDCNPDGPTHWLYQRAVSGVTTLITSTHEDNPLLYSDDGQLTEAGEAYMHKLDRLTGVRYLRLRQGVWAAAEGLVYEMFDPAVHLSDRFGHEHPPPAEWPRYLAIDFGYTNPFVCQWWAVDPDGVPWLYREIYRTNTLVEDHARQIKELHGDEPQPYAVICDHDAEDRATLERHLGYSTTAASKNVVDGVQITQERMRPDPNGRVRIQLCRGALVMVDPVLEAVRKPTRTIDEVTRYVWDNRPQPGGGNVRENPRKVHDHGMDAMRYLCMYLEGNAGTLFRTFYT